MSGQCQMKVGHLTLWWGVEVQATLQVLPRRHRGSPHMRELGAFGASSARLPACLPACLAAKYCKSCKFRKYCISRK